MGQRLFWHQRSPLSFGFTLQALTSLATLIVPTIVITIVSPALTQPITPQPITPQLITPKSLLAPKAALTSNLVITPKNPQLGDTISIVIQGSPTQGSMQDSPEQPDSVKWGDRTYPIFSIGNNRFRALIPTTPLDRPGPRVLQVLSKQGALPNIPATTLQLRGRSFPTQSIWLPPGQDGNVSDWEFDQVDAFKRIVSADKLWNGVFLRPNDGPVTTIYGVQRYYNGVFAKDYYHRGVDYAGNHDSAVVAPAPGRVALIGYEKDGYKVHGNVIGLDHGQGVTSVFIHLNRIRVKLGDRVTAGQTIGTVGNTGASVGPHLHWGLYVHGQSVDPVPWREGVFE